MDAQRRLLGELQRGAAAPGSLGGGWRSTMKLPLQITFRHLTPSQSVEAAVKEKADQLDRFCSTIIGCRVAIELIHHKHDTNSVYHVRIDLTVPGDELVVGRDVRLGPVHQDVYVAIREAFHAMRRQVEDYVRRCRGYVKSPRPPAGR
jgi:ribosome-associated translation inhibitor RaiA